MRPELLERLERASLSKFSVPERDIDWRPPFLDDLGAAIPEETLSLYSLPIFDRMSSKERAHLARHEIASTFSISIRFEDALIRTLARMVQRSDPLEPEIPYLLHEVEEEARHNRMFVRLIREIGVGSYPLDGWFGRFEYGLSSLVNRCPSLFLTSVLAVEDITDRLFATWLAWEGTHPVVRQVCRIHRMEEARHIGFGEAYLSDRYPRAGAVERGLVRYLGPLTARLIFDLLVPPSVYVRAGVVPGPREAWRLWREACASQHRSRFRRECVASLAGCLDRIGAIDRHSRRVWVASGLLAA